MLLDSRVAELTEAFYKWELRGRGWATYAYPVVLEPPFRPFYLDDGRARIDDVRRHTWLSSFVEQFRSARLAPQQGPLQSQPLEEPQPDPDLAVDAEWTEFLVALPQDARVSRPALLGWLRSLSAAAGRVAFELVGGGRSVEVRLAAIPSEAAHVLTQLRAAFPQLVAVDAPATLQERWVASPGQPFVAIEFGLGCEFMVPLALGRGVEEPLLPLIAALAGVDEEELGLVQVLFEETRAPWAESVVRSVRLPDGKPFFMDAPEITSLALEKVASPLFAVVLRIVTSAPEFDRAWEIARRVASGIAQFGNPRTNELIPLAPDDFIALESDLLGRTTHRPGMLLSLEELALLIQLPGAGVQIPELWRAPARTKPAPHEVREPGCFVGVNEHAGVSQAVRLPTDAKTKHVHIVGGSGTGKSTLMVRMIVEDIEHGHGVGVLDPHGDLIDEVLSRIPQDRLEDVVLFDPSDQDAVIGWNILGAHSEAEKDLLASDLVGVFRRLSTSWGDQMTAVLANAITVFLESKRGGTLEDLRRFLVDDRFRKQILDTVADKHVVSFWTTEFPLLIGRRPQAPILTRLDTFLRSKLIRRVVTVRQPKLDFREVTDRGLIFLGKLATGALGEENAALLGSLLVSKFHQVTLMREAQAAEDRQPFFLYMDEFQQVATASMASLFSGARKYRLGVVVAHQDLYQLHRSVPEVERSLLANAYTRICFRLGEEDARQLEKGFSFFRGEDLMRLRVGEALCRVGGRDADFNLKVPALEPVDREDAEWRREAARELSRQRWGTPVDSPEEDEEEEKEEADKAVNQKPIAVESNDDDVPAAAKPGGLQGAWKDSGQNAGLAMAAEAEEPIDSSVDKAELDYLELVAVEPFLTTRERNEALGLSAWKGQQLKTGLLENGLVNEVAINPGGRGEQFKLLELTRTGRTLLVEYGIAPSAGHGRGGLAHQWWARSIAKWLREEQGIEATVEDDSSGARVDLQLFVGGSRIAIEIEMTDGHLVENLRKDVLAEFDTVVCLVHEDLSVPRIEARVAQNPELVDHVSRLHIGELRAFEAILARVLPSTPPPLQRKQNIDGGVRRRQRPVQRAASSLLDPMLAADSGALPTPAAAAYLGLSPATLETLRTRGGGPPFVKLGRRVVYRREDLDSWITERRRSSTSDGGGSAR